MTVNRTQSRSNRCPTDEELADFSRGKLTIEADNAIGDHLAVCQRCQEALERLDDDVDTFIAEIREGAEQAPIEAGERNRIVRLVSQIAPNPDETYRGDSEGDGSKRSGITVRCPYCRSAIEIGDSDPLGQLACLQCESSFRLAGNPPRSEDASASHWTVAHFDLLDQVGMGRFGSVWKAHDTHLGETVAVKVPRRGELAPEEIEQFLREARSASQVDHANVVRVREVGTEGDSVYIVSDFVDGVSLKDWLDGQPTEPRIAAEFCAALADALHAAHTAGVVHRDLKPANILVDANRQPHVTDFGLARRETADVTITVEGHILGTPAYMSPEQARGKGHEADARSDIYSLGVILYEMLAGQPPFRGDTHMLVPQILWDEPSSLRKLNDRVPRDLETICLKCLEKRPAQRYQSAADLADDLRRFLVKEAIRARPVTRLARLARWARRSPGVATLWAVVLASVISTLATIVVAYHQASVAFRQTSAAYLETSAAYRQASEALEQSRINLYYHQIAEAHRLWLANDPEGVATVLDDCPPELRGFEWGFLHRLGRSDAMTLRYAGGPVATSPDGRRIATGGGPQQLLKIWDARTGRKLTERGGNGYVRYVDYSSDGQMIVTANDGKRVLLWDVAQGREFRLLRVLGTNSKQFLLAQFSPDDRFVASGGNDRVVRTWETATGKPLLEIDLKPWSFRTLAISPDSKQIAISSTNDSDVSVRLWDAESGSETATIPTYGKAVMSLDYSPDGRRLALGEAGGMLRIWDLVDSQQALTIPGPMSRIPCVTFSPDAAQIAAVTWDNSVRVYDSENGREIVVLHGHGQTVLDMAYSSDGRNLVTGCADDKVRVWDIEAQQGALSLHGPERNVRDLAFDPEGRLIAAASDDGAIRLWQTDDGQELPALSANDSPVRALAFSMQGQLAAAGDDAIVRIWDLASRKVEREFTEHTKCVRTLAFSPDGNLVASAGRDREVLLWEADTGRVLHTFPLVTAWIDAVAFSPDGRWLAAGGRNAEVIVWDVETGQRQWMSNEPGLSVLNLAWTPSGESLAAARVGGGIHFYDTPTGELKDSIREPTAKGHTDFAFSPDGTRLAVAVDRTSVSLWELPSGRRVLSLDHRPDVRGLVAFSPTGDCVASADKDGTVRLWKSED